MAAYLVVDSVTRRLYEVFNGGATREDVKKDSLYSITGCPYC
ncbi:hypothetical protein EDC91_10355 [Shewanella fodinae]|uniref:Uncharacterized protein n=1 Tax=Shewanella fodinae TaxID=552357 RepID=A0A4R2FFB4_9GAMM|nr:hypothetical protein EDC91_10355 [Shewanella fodinae]